MKAMKIPAAHDSHPNVTPLIDIVMCLIIFYMLVAKIGVNTGADQKIELPYSGMGIKISDLGNTITLNVVRNGEETLVTAMGEDGQVIPIPVATMDGKRPLLNFLKKAKGANAEFKAIIRADQNLDYRYIEPVLITCAEAAVKNVNFCTRIEKKLIN